MLWPAAQISLLLIRLIHPRIIVISGSCGKTSLMKNKASIKDTYTTENPFWPATQTTLFLFLRDKLTRISWNSKFWKN